MLKSMKTLPKDAFDFDAYLNREERELVLLYLGSSTCGFCIEPQYKALLIEAKERLAPLALARHMKMRTIGVSIDWSISEGIAFLEDAGEWNEIVVGNNWYNSAVIEHVWGVAEATGGVPQVIVFERKLKHTTEPHRVFEIQSKRYLVRLRNVKIITYNIFLI